MSALCLPCVCPLSLQENRHTVSNTREPSPCVMIISQLTILYTHDIIDSLFIQDNNSIKIDVFIKIGGIDKA